MNEEQNPQNNKDDSEEKEPSEDVSSKKPEEGVSETDPTEEQEPESFDSAEDKTQELSERTDAVIEGEEPDIVAGLFHLIRIYTVGVGNRLDKGHAQPVGLVGTYMANIRDFPAGIFFQA